MSRTRSHHKRKWPEMPKGWPIPPVALPYPNFDARYISGDARDVKRASISRRDPLHPEVKPGHFAVPDDGTVSKATRL